MKTASSKFLIVAFGSIIYAIILFLIMMALPVSAQTNALAGIEAKGLVAATNGASASNAVAVVATGGQKSSAQSPAVRVDESGIHIGGENPVDIKVPGFSKTGFIAALALLVPFAPFVMVIAIVAIMFYTIHRRNKLLHENLRAMIDKGMPITPELMDSLKGKHSGVLGPFDRSRRPRGLLPGLVLTGIGVALMINGRHFSGGGLIVFFIGIAFLIVWFVERMDRNNSQPPKQ